MPAFTQIAPLLAVVAFWILIFLFAFVFSARALQAPPAEHDELEGHEAEGHEQSAPVAQDNQVPTKPGH